MQVVLHCGVYSTDMTQLLDALRANCTEDLPHRTQVSDPEHIRVFLRRLLRTAGGSELSDDARGLIMDVADIPTNTERVILSNPAILGTYRDFAKSGQFFPNAVRYLQTLTSVFQEDEVEICFAMKNPATLLSSVLQAASTDDLERLLGQGDAMQLRWSNLIARIQQNFPQTPITVWYNEDTPLIWRSLLLHFLRLPEDAPIQEAFMPLASLLSEVDLKRFHAYLQKHPGMTISQERRVIATFIDKFVTDDLLDEEINIDGWNQEYVNHLTALYEEDQHVIAGMENVTLIAP